MVIVEDNPYRTLVIRGVLGAASALTYAVLGAPDVALTEALVGTLLAIALYAVAVRSSMVMRLGVLQEDAIALDTEWKAKLQEVLKKRHLRVELVPYLDKASLSQALTDKEIHATCTPLGQQGANIAFRLRHLYELVQTELTSSAINVTYLDANIKQEQL